MYGRVIRIVDSLIDPPALPPVTVEYAKRHMRGLGISEDVLVETWIRGAASYFSEQTGRPTILETREAWLDGFPGDPGVYGFCRKIQLPHPPLQEVLSVTYVGEDGTEQTFTDGGSPDAPLYSVRAPQGPYAECGTLEPLYGHTWPIARAETGAVRIRYTCGYGSTPDDIPPLVVGIICALVTHFDKFRGAVYEARHGQVLELAYGVRSMMDAFKYTALGTQVLRGSGPYDGVGGSYL